MPNIARKRGISLSVKLILTTAVLLALAVGAAGFFSVRAINDLATREAGTRRAAGEQSMKREAELLSRSLATSAAPALAEFNQGYLEELARTTVQADSRIQWIVMAADNKRIVARTAGAPAGDVLDDPLRAEVMAAGALQVVNQRDAADPTRFTFGVKIKAGDRLVGDLRLGVSTAELERELATSIAAARKRSSASARTIALVAGAILIAGILLGAWQGLHITRPLAALSDQAHRIAGGDLAHRVQTRSRDEIGLLAQDFNFMADRIGALLAETATRASLEKEMSLARSVQESMIPPPRLIVHGPYHVIGHYEPAAACGGDWWTVHFLSGERTLLAIGDVTGHGVAAALLAATARGAVEALASIDENLLAPEHVLRAIDSAIRGVGGEQLLMTCFAALIDARAGTISYSNAAHNFPYICHMDEQRTLRGMTVLAMRGSPLGNTQGVLELQSGQKRLREGDTLVFFTDGVIDRLTGSGQRFGDRRLRQALAGRSMPIGGGAVTSLRSDLLAQLASFSAGAPADDDVTFVILQFDPASLAGQARRPPRSATG